MFLNSLWKSASRSRTAVPANISRRASRNRPQARRLRCEALEDRRLLSVADFELSSLLPANGGDGSNGFVVSGIRDYGRLGYPLYGSQPLGDVNQDGIDDFYLAAPGSNGGTVAGQAYLIFGRAGGGFPAELDLTALDGTTGYVIDGVFPRDNAGADGGGAGDMNHDDIPDIAIMAIWKAPAGNFLVGGRTFVLYGGSANLAALDLADGVPDGRIALATFDAPAADGTHGFVINGYEKPAPWVGGSLHVVSAAGDVNGDQVDDLLISAPAYTGANWYDVFVVFGRDSTAGNTFPAAFELSSLLAANGGDGSDGFIIPPVATSSSAFGFLAGGAGDINHDGFGDLFISDGLASPSGRAYAGQVHVIFGQTSFAATFDIAALNGNNGFTVNGKTAGDNLGWPAGPAGDVNGDGVDDLLMSAALLDAPDGRAYVGGAYVLFGKTGAFPAALEVSTLNGSNGFVMYGVTASDCAGCSSAAGDVNGDGYDDVILSAHQADPNGITNAGQSYVVYGRPSFGPSVELAGLLAANGGDGSRGYALNGFVAGNGGGAYVAGIGDVNGDGFADVRIGSIYVSSNGLAQNGQAYIVYGKPSPAPTRFFVVNDASPDKTYEYLANGGLNESYNLNSGNTAPRGVASTTAGDKIWVVDANRKVYVYNPGGGLLGSWTAGSLPTNATVEDIAVGCQGNCIWIVDARSDMAYHYSGAASCLSGTKYAGHSFRLNSGNTNPKGIVTDETYVWVVNDGTTDKVFKYTLLGNLVGSWTIDSANKSPTGLTIDPTGASQDIWIVDSGTDKVYQYANARGKTSGSQSAAATFALAAGNTNPQGIADPPAPGSMLPTGLQPDATLFHIYASRTTLGPAGAASAPTGLSAARASISPEMISAIDLAISDLAGGSTGRKQSTKADHDLLLATYDPLMWL